MGFRFLHGGYQMGIRRIRRGLALLLAVVTLMAFGPVQALAQTLSITGTVYFEGAGPAQGVGVGLMPNDVWEGTDPAGAYRFYDLPPGQYQLEFHPPQGNYLYSPIMNVPVTYDGVNTVVQDVYLPRADVGGIVQDYNSDTAGGAWVGVFNLQDQFMDAATVSDEVYGTFTLDLNALPDGNYYLRAHRPGGRIDVADSAEIPFSKPGDLPLVLDGADVVTLPQATVNGHVSHANGGGPAEDARVELRLPGNNEGPPDFFTHTSSDGGFSLAVGAGTYNLRAWPPEGSDDTPSEAIEVSVPGGPNLDLTIELTSPSFTGRVVDPDGDPVPSLWVQVKQGGQPLPGNSYTVESDGDGWFKVGPLPDGVYTLDIIPQGGGTYGSLTGLGPYTYTGSLINLGELQLPDANVTGRVVEPDGTTPVENAHVQLHTHNWSQVYFANTGADGRLYLSVPAGTYMIEVQPPQGSDYAGPAPAEVTVPAEGLDLGDIALVQPLIWGQVTEPDGITPVPWVWVVAHNANWSVNAGGATDENGEFRIGGLPPGTYYVEAFPPPDSEFAGAAKVTVTIVEEDPGHEVDLVLVAPNVVGIVLTPDEEPVPGANVYIHTPDWSKASFGPPTGVDGGFNLAAPDGTYLLEVNPPPPMPGEASILAAPPPVEVTIAGGAVTVVDPPAAWDGDSFVLHLVAPDKTVSGTVTTTGGDPVEGAVVEAFRWNGPGHAQAYTDAGGQYELALTGGEWGLMVHPDWGSPADWIYDGMPRKVTFGESDPDEQIVDFEVIAADSSVTGQVVKPNGDPWDGGPGLYVDVRSKNGRGNGAPVEIDGSFSVRVPAGSYVVMVHAPPDAPFGSPDPVPLTVGEGETVDVGEIALKAKSSTISGTVVDANGGAPIESMMVVAFQPMGGGFAMDTSAADGSYSLAVSAGNWEVIPWDMSGEYVYNQPPQRVKVGADEDRENVNFSVVSAGATIQGSVVDAEGHVLTDLFGFAFAQPEDGIGGFGGPLEGGRFTLRVPAGTYTVSGGLPPGSGYTLSGQSEVTVSDGGTVAIQLVAVANDATIGGQIRDEDGQILAHVPVHIFAIEEGGSVQEAFSEDGEYVLSVSAGTWRIGFDVDPSTGYVSQPPSDSRVTVGAGGSETYDITLTHADATIQGTVTRPGDGGTVPANGAWVAVRKRVSAGERPLELGTIVQPDGSFSIDVPAGTYEVGAFLPPKEGLINPPVQQVTVGADGTAEVSLAFRESDAQVSGTVSLDEVGVGATVFAWSDEGGYMETEADENGDYTLNLVAGEGWHVGAFYQDEDGHYRAEETDVTPPQAGVDLTLAAIAAEIPDVVQVTFDAGSMQVINLSNGVRIEIPAGALASEGNVTVVATPVAGMRKQRDANPIGIGYDLVALDADNQPITTMFYKAVTVTVPYDEADLEAAGLTEDDLVPAYWSEDTGRWEPLTSVTVDTEANTITWTVDHFTQFAVVGGSQEGQDDQDDQGGSPGGGTPETPQEPDASDTFTPAEAAVLEDSGKSFKLEIPVGAIEAADGSSVEVSVTKIAPADVDELIDGASPPAGFKSIGKAFEFKAEVTKDGTATAVTTFKKPVTFAVTLSGDDLAGVSDPDKVGLFRLNDDGTLTFVGGKLVDGKLVVKLYGFSKYVLAEVNVAFTDLAGHWAKGDVELMAAKYVAKGLPGGRFDPAGQVTRAQFAAMLVRAMGLPAAPASTTFTDVKTGDWFYAEVMTAVQAGIVNGMGDGTFRPGDPVTREQVAAMVARALKAAGRQVPGDAQAAQLLASFADAAAVSGWAVADLALAVQEGIVRGQTATAIAPAAGATRAEAAVMIARYWRK